MNRMEEYLSLMEELEQPVPELENTLDRARKRVRRKQYVLRPLASIAACFALFVALVNFCAPVAYACSQVPVLKDLAAAVTFSPSLQDAVENEYVQPISLTQTDNGITASVEYLIVDQKQVNVFFSLDSETYTGINVYPEVTSECGHRPVSCSYALNGWDVPNGQLQSLTIDFVDEDVPDKLWLKLKVYTNEVVTEEQAPENSQDMLLETDFEEPAFIASFDFLLEFDPAFTASRRVYPINQTVTLDGQKITITDMEVYPTHLRVNVADDPENTAWLTDLDFYIETDWGMRFNTGSGITATGSGDSPAMASYRAESTYFYEAKHLKLVITGAKWLDKDMERVCVDLQTGQTGPMPEGVTFHSAQRAGDSWILEMKVYLTEDEVRYQRFGSDYYDAAGECYDIHSWSTIAGEFDADGEMIYYIEQFPLIDYPYEEVWLSPVFSRTWVAEDVIVLTVQ